MATLQIRTEEGWRQDAGPLGSMAWTLCEMLGIQDGHRWRRQGASFRHGPVVVLFGPGEDGPRRAWIAAAPKAAAWRIEHLAKRLDEATGPQPSLRVPEDEDDQSPWTADLGQGWTLEVHERPHSTPDPILVRDAQGYGRDGGRFGPVRGPWPVARLSIEKGRPMPLEQGRAEAPAMARALLSATGSPEIDALERLLPAGTPLSRSLHVSLLPEDWRHGTPAPGLPAAAQAIVESALQTRYGKRGPAATPGFTATGFHDGLTHPASWSVPWRARGGSAPDRAGTAIAAPALVEALA